LERGVTVITVDTGIFSEFAAVNFGILPIPFAGKPIDGLLFSHS
jgi:hypothetical protein